MATEGRIFGYNLEISFQRLKQNLEKRGKHRLLWQFRNSPVLNSLIEKMAVQMQDVYDTGIECLKRRTLAEAEGVNLDVIGRIVGQDRLWDKIDFIPYFTSDLTELSVDRTPVWVTNAPRISQRMAQDKNYRRMILAKIFKNHSTAGSQPENVYCAQFVAGYFVSFVKTGIQSYRLAFADGSGIETIILLMKLWKTEAVQYFYFLPIPATVHIDTENYFSLPTEDGYSMGFGPDMYETRPDYAKAAISVNLGGYL